MSVMQKELDIYLTHINNNHGNSTPAVTDIFVQTVDKVSASSLNG